MTAVIFAHLMNTTGVQLTDLTIHECSSSIFDVYTRTITYLLTYIITGINETYAF